ncbi:MAG: 7-cyano-7-deazaguanine synthase QueC [Spirochaetales bacterium]|nr:7-cyano-7-deazaguanine synthase QueC [Spirochaetales bacterium]
MNQEEALVLASGGQDSTTCLYWAAQNFARVHAISFTYGQKHATEVASAQRICGRLNVDLKVVDLSFMTTLTESALFQGQGDLNDPHALSAEVPASFVPYRNLLFFTAAAQWAATLRLRHLVTGVCQTDYSGYADCREVFVKSAQTTLNLATDFSELGVIIHTPLMWLTKAQEFALAEELGCLEVILTDTITCYQGVLTQNDFGRGCGECPACRLRKKGWDEFLSQRGNTARNSPF